MATDTQIYTSKYTGKQIDDTLSTCCFITNLKDSNSVKGVELGENITDAVVVNNFIKEQNENKYRIENQRVVSLLTYVPQIIPSKFESGSWSESSKSGDALDSNFGTLYYDIGGMPADVNILGVRITSNDGITSGLGNDRDTWPEIICDNRIIKGTESTKLRIYSNKGITGQAKVTYTIKGGNS